MTASRGSPLLAYVFSSPLVKETWRGDLGDAEFVPVLQRNYAPEREVIARYRAVSSGLSQEL